MNNHSHFTKLIQVTKSYNREFTIIVQPTSDDRTILYLTERDGNVRWYECASEPGQRFRITIETIDKNEVE